MAAHNGQASKRPAKRQRRPHRKSRLGCKNCKIRSIKCDEAKPACERCTDAGFSCSYRPAAPSSASSSLEPALELAHEGAFQVQLGKSASPSPTPDSPPSPIRIPIATPHGSIGDHHYELTAPDFLALEDFQNTVSQTFARVSLQEYTLMGVRNLGNEHPYLLHSYLTVAYIYQRDLCVANNVPRSSKSRAALAFHWYQASVLHYHTLLATGQSSSEKDAIWAAASLLSAAAFGYLESHEPSQHWPNKPTESGDHYWLRLIIGKKAVCDLACPMREGSLFQNIIHDMGIWNPPIPSNAIPIGTFPATFMSLFDLNEASTVDTNVYFGPASMLAQLIPEPCDSIYVFRFLGFPKFLGEPFCHLLASKDPRALLLLCWWWAKACVYDGWWLSRRATVEGRAICMYLEANSSSDLRIIELLEFPRAVFSLLDQSVPLAVARSTYITEPSLAVLI